ncbi:Glycerophosphoryl diester phosphodiesterase [Candidatus Rhodobacter oscarellae]|uniref:Glycerophosphoryl diester phosphodiesterase n=1 Tax=Candidatus Rhodobacter oscarellae TaxID=1675527 RepID=A0A0J9ED29_9RHOB|nr:glycerophosphodiester phosphodiesterase family protein [Candidatus Rhodobacter lobularis]KMW60610.1 Glycerophosphoryl diester phosphodiesterase [Candidatus Rhodobacter lobularis]
MTGLPEAFLNAPIAHRGYHSPGRPENSRAAFEAAIAAGYGIELDLQLSADGQAMVFHDYLLDRLTGATGPVVENSAAALGAIQLTGGDEGIPTLTEVLDLVAGRAPLLIELKDQDGALGPDIGALERATARALSDYQGPVALMSFNPHAVAQLAELCPDIPRGLVTDPFLAEDWDGVPDTRRSELRDIPDYLRVGACFISHNVTDLGAPAVAARKAAGAMVLCWTVRSPEIEARARKIADNVTFEGYAAVLP